MNSSQSKTRMIAWVVWVIASLFYAYQYILRVMPSIMLSDIMQKFHIDAATFGQFSGVYYIGYSLMHLPIGILFDRYGPRKVMTSCILLSVVGLLPLIFADHWAFPIIGRILVGIGSSAAILGVFKIVRMTFSEKHFSRMLSFSVMIGLMGAIYGGAPVGLMKDVLGYELVTEIFAGVGILLAAVAYWLVPDTKSEAQTTVLSDIREVLTNGRVLWTCVFAGLMVGPLEGFADVWGTAFLKQVYNYDGSLAASLPSMIFIGMCFGAPILSFVAEKSGNYLMTIIAAGAAMALSFFLLLATPLNPGTISINFLLVGICSAYQILTIYKASTYAREEVAGLTTAMANMIIMIFGYVFHTLMGFVINSMGGPKAAQALFYGVGIIPVALCLGTVGFIFLSMKERKANKLIKNYASK